MNTIYLIKDEKHDYALFKVGFTTNLKNRVYQYSTHNPEANIISTIKTQSTSKRKVEGLYHNEIEARGYMFVISPIDHKSTEWFKVAYDDPFYSELCTKGLNAFKCGANRKNYGEYHIA